MARLLKHGFQLSLLIACGYFILHNLDVQTLWRALRGIGFVPLALGTLLTSIVIIIPPALRLAAFSKGEATFQVALLATVLSLGLNNVLPAKLGDAAKVYTIHQRAHLSIAKGVEIVFWERFFDINALLVFSTVTVAFFGHWKSVRLLILIVTGIWIFLILLRSLPVVRHNVPRLIPYRPIQKVVEETLRCLYSRLKIHTMVYYLVLSIAVWALYALVPWTVLVWMAGLPLGVSQVMAVFVISALGMALPSSPGAIGVYEASMILALGWFGVDKETSLALALVCHAMQIVPTTLGLALLTLAGQLNLPAILAKPMPPKACSRQM